MHIYDKAFYEDQKDGSYISAKEILPIIFNLVHFQSVVDIGCGVGTWLKACEELGVNDILGLDGPYVSEQMLRIPASKFQKSDLTKPITIARKFDLVISLEVAEHLPEINAETFVESLTKLGSIVLFSAAIPSQGGHNHVNEQWQSYWADKFLKKDYVAIDCVRPLVWKKDTVEWWYAQNILLFVSKAELIKYTELEELYQKTNINQLDLVHPENYKASGNVERVSLVAVLTSLPERFSRIFFK